MSDLPDPTAIAGRGPLADKLAGGGGEVTPPDAPPPPPTYTGPDDAPPWVTFAGQAKADDVGEDESPERRRQVAAIARIIANRPAPEAAEAIVAMFDQIPRAENPGADVPQGEQRWEACPLCGALIGNGAKHFEWHDAMGSPTFILEER
jgi:hypothetical protein